MSDGEDHDSDASQREASGQIQKADTMLCSTTLRYTIFIHDHTFFFRFSESTSIIYIGDVDKIYIADVEKKKYF